MSGINGPCDCKLGSIHQTDCRNYIEVTDSEQWRVLVDHPKHGRVELFDGAYWYSPESMGIAFDAHQELGTAPVIQKRSVRVTYQYGDWEVVDREAVPTQN